MAEISRVTDMSIHFLIKSHSHIVSVTLVSPIICSVVSGKLMLPEILLLPQRLWRCRGRSQKLSIDPSVP